MKILFISIYDPFTASGPSNHLLGLSEALRDLGCEVHILTVGYKNDVCENGLFVHYLKSGFLGGFGQGFLFSLLSIGTINQLIKRYNIDVVHGQSPSSFGYALLTFKKVPFVVTLHGTSFGELYSLFNVPINAVTSKIVTTSFIQALTAFLTSIEYNFAHRVIAVSKSVSKEAEAYYHLQKHKVHVIYNGINPLQKTNTTNNPKEYSLLFVGRLIWRKGAVYLIEALPTVLSKYPHVNLKIVGAGDQRISLDKKVESLGIQKHVHFLSDLSIEELTLLYFEADLYLQPSLYEPLGLAVMEAMSAGKAVIGSNVGGIPELVSHGKEGLLVEPGNSRQISEAILTLLANPVIKTQYGHAAKHKIENDFSWIKIAEKTLAFYVALTEKKDEKM